MAFNTKQYILDERAKGTPDSDIYETIKTTKIEDKPERTGAGELLPSLFAVGGGVIGGITGAAVGGVGAVPGSIAGAAAGGAAGEFVQQKIEKTFGERERISPAQAVATGAISAATEATGALAFKVGGKILQMTKPKFLNIMSRLSGFDDKVVEKAFTRTPGAVEATKEGEKTLNEIVKNSSKKFNEFAKQKVVDSAEELKRIIKEEPLSDALIKTGEKFKGQRGEILKKSGDFVNKTDKSIRSSHNIGVSKTGILNFDRKVAPSRIVSVSERKGIQQAYDSLRSVRENMSLKHVNAINEKLIALRSKTPAGSPTGKETKSVIGDMMSGLNNFTKKVYPESYTNFLEQNLKNRVLINQGKDIFGSTRHPSPKEVSQISNKLLQVFNSGKQPIKESVEEIGKKIGEDPIGAAAGTLLEAGEQVSVRAPQLTQRGLLVKTLEFLPRQAVTNFVKTGNISGEILNHKMIKALSVLTGKSTKVIANEVLNLAAEKKTE